MVIDNMHTRVGGTNESFREEQDVRPYFPASPRGTILVTTKGMEAGPITFTAVIQVKTIDKREAGQLLHAYLLGIDVILAELSALASRLAFVPLALVQAAAFIKESAITVSNYLELLDKKGQDISELQGESFEQGPGTTLTVHPAMAETWILSFKEIERQNSFAGDILSLMSFFDPHAIPVDFLYHYAEQQPDQKG
jgi:hypothetical protein